MSQSDQSSDLEWWRQPLIILAHAYGGEADANDAASIEQLVKWKRSMGFDTEHLILNRSMMEGEEVGDDSQAYLFKNRHGYKEDWLGKYLPVAHKLGMRVIIYFNCHWFRRSSFPDDWFLVDASGQPATFYGSGGGVCPRGPFRQWSAELAEDLGKYPIDGVFLDGPSQHRCWCSACRDEFQDLHERPLPASTAECSRELAIAYAEFPSDGAGDYVRAFAQGLRRTNPDAILYINDRADGGDGKVMTATADVTDLVGSEGGFVGYRPLEHRFAFGPGVAAKVLECRARGRGRVVFSDCGYKSFDYHAHPTAEISRMYAGTIANGANPWFLVLRDAQDSQGIQTALRFNRLIAENRASLANGDSLAEAALLHSPLNLQLAASTEREADDVGRRDAGTGRLAVSRHFSEFEGVYAALARSGYPFDVIEELNLLADELSDRTKLIILPAAGAVADETAEALRKFVSGGGCLLATFDSTLFDAEGRRRDDYALADVFGASIGGDLVGPSKLDYLGVTEENDLTRGTSQAVLPCPEYWWHIKAADAAEPLLFYHGKMPRRYAQLPPVSPNPAAVVHRFGGGRAVLIPSAIGDHYRHWTFPDERVLLANAARMLADPPVQVIGGDEFIETTLRRGANGAVVVHLVNWASAQRPATRAIRIGPLDIRVRLPKDAESGSVEGQFTAGALEFSAEQGAVRFTLPRLEEYEMLVIM